MTIPNPQEQATKENPSINDKVKRKYDLIERTVKYAKDVSDFLGSIRKTDANFHYSKQLIRSSSSVGANYIESNDALGKKDFMMRIKICRKEAKESMFWLRLLETGNEHLENKRGILINESIELTKIFGSIVVKMTNRM